MAITLNYNLACNRLLRAAMIACAVMLTGLTARAESLADFLANQPPRNQTIVSVDDAKAGLDSMPHSQICGIWQFTQGGTFAIVPDSYSDRMAIIALDSPWRNLMPGTIIGAAMPTGKKGVYEALLYRTISAEGIPSAPKKIIVTVTDSTHINFLEVKNGIKINPWRLIPYMFRGLISSNDNRPVDLNGALLMYHPAQQHRHKPRLL